MESQPQNPEFSNNPENFHTWYSGTTECLFKKENAVFNVEQEQESIISVRMG